MYIHYLPNVFFFNYTQVDGRAAAAPKQIEGDVLPAVIDATARMDEKIHRLPVGGEGWDTKMKKKRSVGAVGSRVIKAERDIKRPMQLKLGSESKLRSCDVQAFRYWFLLFIKFFWKNWLPNFILFKGWINYHYLM